MSVPIAVLFSGRDLRRGSNQLRSVCLKHVKLSFAASVFSNGLWLLASFANTPEASPARLGRQTARVAEVACNFFGGPFCGGVKTLRYRPCVRCGQHPGARAFRRARRDFEHYTICQTRAQPRLLMDLIRNSSPQDWNALY
jgi:hypothetical protein